MSNEQNVQDTIASVLARQEPLSTDEVHALLKENEVLFSERYVGACWEKNLAQRNELLARLGNACNCNQCMGLPINQRKKQ